MLSSELRSECVVDPKSSIENGKKRYHRFLLGSRRHGGRAKIDEWDRITSLIMRVRCRCIGLFLPQGSHLEQDRGEPGRQRSSIGFFIEQDSHPDGEKAGKNAGQYIHQRPTEFSGTHQRKGFDLKGGKGGKSATKAGT